MEQRPYAVTPAERRVDAWSTVRLPFEPKGWLREYRRDLQGGLRAMTATPSSILYAEYAAPDLAFADLENVLLYNVGSGCYSHLAGKGIICRRMPSVDHLHHLHYASVEPTQVTVPRGAALASGRLADPPFGSSAGHWWAAFRDNLHPHEDRPYGGQFGVRVHFGTAWPRSITSSAKALLDGLVAALHVHDGSAREHVTEALRGIGDGERLWDLLNNPGTAILGPRRLVRPHGTKIAWNPADELCSYFELVRNEDRVDLDVQVLAL